MKILWLCRWFGNYRIPVYKELHRLTNGDFYMAYSEESVSKLVNEQMKEALGNNALPLENEKHLIIGNPDSNFANKYLDVAWQPGILDVISKVNPDVIISDGFYQWTYAGILKSFHRKLCIFYERTSYVERNAPKWRQIYRKCIGHFADGFIINGSLTKEYLKTLGLDNKPLAIGCMVADSEGLSKAVKETKSDEIADLKEQLNIKQGGLIYLFVGQLVKRKGIDELLKEWCSHIKNYPDDYIIVAGQGVLEKELKDKYGDIPGVRFVGQVSYDKIHSYYAMADVVVMPTLEDNWSLVVPEAMSCAKPVMTTVYNGCHVELIDQGNNGYRYDPLIPGEGCKILGKFHEKDLESMGKRSQEMIVDYTPVKAAEKIYKLCQEITKK